MREKRPACEATYDLVCNHDVTLLLTCDDDAGHADEPGAGDQHYHYNRERNLYWLEGLPPTPRHVPLDPDRPYLPGVNQCPNCNVGGCQGCDGNGR